jgi:hypothetical protein
MDRKRILRVSAIVAVAGVTGFVMQSQDKAPPPQRISAAVVVPAVPVAPAPVVAEAPAPVLVAASADPVITPLAAPMAAAAPTDCSADIALIPRDGAMLDLGLLAPCRADQRVLIRHGGLVITDRTSAAGTLVASIPALQSPAEVTFAFADGTEASETTDVADLSRYDRFAVQWMGDDAFQLHAYAEGLAGDAAHIHAASPNDVTAAGSFLVRLGDRATDRPLLAEVYTWPAGRGAFAGTATLDIEAEVTEATCGREILGETLQLTAGRLVVRDLTIAMPGCDAVGEYVVLPNPVIAEKLVAN